MPIIAVRGSADKLRLFYNVNQRERVSINSLTSNFSDLPALDSHVAHPPACVDLTSLSLRGEVRVWYVSYQTYFDNKGRDFESDSRAYFIYDANSTYLIFYYSHNPLNISMRLNQFVYGFSYGYRDGSLPPVHLVPKNTADDAMYMSSYEQVALSSNLANGK